MGCELQQILHYDDIFTLCGEDEHRHANDMLRSYFSTAISGGAIGNSDLYGPVFHRASTATYISGGALYVADVDELR